MAKLVMKETKSHNYIVLFVLLAILVYMIFLR
jgi:hypothetical protein